jgi:hypothetical protein
MALVTPHIKEKVKRKIKAREEQEVEKLKNIK